MGNRTAVPASPPLRLRSILRPAILTVAVALTFTWSGGAPARAAVPLLPAPAAVARPAVIASVTIGGPESSAARTQEPSAAASAAPVVATGQLVTRDVFRAGDFVTQYTDVACVGASIQMMLNMIRGGPGGIDGTPAGPDRSPASQARLLALARTLSPAPVLRRTGGASAFGWAYALSVNGGEPYRVRAYGSLSQAVQAAAAAIARTGRPAGLLVWQGIHAWVASGYRATGNPAQDARAVVTGLIVSDPLWPRPSNSRGRTISPDTFLATSALARHLVRYDRPWGFTGGLNGSFVVVLPVEAWEVGLARAL